MNILDDWIVLDTNVWIFGLRRGASLRECSQLLEHIHQLRVVLPRQILQELQANLSEEEIRRLFRLLSRIAGRLKINWDKTSAEIIAKYRRLGCKLGDAVVAAHLEELGIKVLVTETRDFLEEIENLPFHTLNAAEALAELKLAST